MHEASVTLSPSLLFYGDSGIAVGDTARRRTRCRAGFYRHYGTGNYPSSSAWRVAVRRGATDAAKRGGVPAAAQGARHFDASTAQAHRLKARAATRRKAAAAAEGGRARAAALKVSTVCLLPFTTLAGS